MENLIESSIRIYINSGLRYFVFAGIPFLIFYVFFAEKFQKNKIQGRSEKTKRFFHEIKHSLSTMIIITVVVSIVLFTPFREWTNIYDDINEYSIWWIPFSIILSLIIHDTYFYWMHRLVHGKKLYQYVHIVHHQSVNPSPWTSYSFNILEAIAENLILVILVFVLPLHPLAILGFGLISFIINVYGHLGYEIAPRWFRYSIFFEFVNTSVHHNLHHKKFFGNYGLYFRIWDRLMGTEHPNYVKEYDKIQTKRFGSETYKNNKLVTFPIFLIGISLITMSFGYPNNQSTDISGKWLLDGEKYNKEKSIVEIYQDDQGKYHGVLLEILDQKKQAEFEAAKIRKSINQVFLLKDFSPSGNNTWNNGIIIAPKRKKRFKGILKLLPSGNLEATGSYLGIKKSMTLERIK